MKYLILIFLTAQTVISFGQNIEIKQESLLGCWIDSREENLVGSNTSIYRPCNFKSFPISRFRFEMIIKEAGECTWLYLAPNDAHHMKDGTWNFDNETMTLKIFNTAGEEVKKFVLAEVGEKILRIKN